MDVVNVEIANLDDLKKRFVEICATMIVQSKAGITVWAMLLKLTRWQS